MHCGFGWDEMGGGRSGVNFINIQQAAFAGSDHKSGKKSYNLTGFFVLSRSMYVKAA